MSRIIAPYSREAPPAPRVDEPGQEGGVKTKLERLNQLRDEGLISKDDYQVRKKQLLDKFVDE